ncbi:WD40 repeat domain-containing protein, partial [Aphanizomenon flos-aquae CCAP 1446/1C]|nr:WD40 repeat domain-containing protein [Anabaena sp. CCAP 1446/1C]
MYVYSLAISPDGKTIVNGNLNKDIDVWNLQTGKIIHQLCGHKNSVNSVAISPNNQI